MTPRTATATWRSSALQGREHHLNHADPPLPTQRHWRQAKQAPEDLSKPAATHCGTVQHNDVSLQTTTLHIG